MIKDIWCRISIQSLLFWVVLPSSQDGGRNRLFFEAMNLWSKFIYMKFIVRMPYMMEVV